MTKNFEDFTRQVHNRASEPNDDQQHCALCSQGHLGDKQSTLASMRFLSSLTLCPVYTLRWWHSKAADKARLWL